MLLFWYRYWSGGIVLAVVSFFCFAANLPAGTVRPGFAETVIVGPASGSWNEAAGVTFDSTGRLFVWERGGRVWFKDQGDNSFSMLLDISEEVGDWGDFGCVGFALDPQFRINGYIYLLYVVDRHYLLYFGTPNYNPATDDYNSATIGRLTRYTCRSSDGFRSVDRTTRLVLIGETKSTGIPICSYTHGTGSLVFGDDGTLLVGCGDGGSPDAVDVGGPANSSYAPQALADGIIQPKEDVGAFRAQLVDSLSGKILRVDPATGNGLPSNPFYDSSRPRAARSRVWALGLRNPFRMTLRPESGSHSPADGKPGILYIGNVGWDTWESLKVATVRGQNFGWPIYEGLSLTPGYSTQAPRNLDAPNPAYPVSGCSQYFSFNDLLKEDTLDPAGQPPFANPCSSSQRIPASIPQFLHARPVLDWNHASATTRTPTYGGSGQAQVANVGAVGSPVSGPQFQGNCSVGGTWYTSSTFPTQFQNSYFHADWGQAVIKNISFTQNDKPLAVADFVSNAGAVVCLAQHPTDGSIYYVSYNYGDAGTVRQLSYIGNRTPVASASADRYFGPTPLLVQFSSQGSTDPDAQSLTYSWDFGDGSASNTAANPAHTFSAPAGVPTRFDVTLKVTDPGGLSAQTKLVVAINDTPPNVTISNPVDGGLYSPTAATTLNLTATVSDSESTDSQLLYLWQTLLHHNDHNHIISSSTNHAASTVLQPIGCDGVNIYYYRIVLTVTDPAGLATAREARVYPNCGTPNTAPTISSISDQSTSQDRPVGPLSFSVGDKEMLPLNLQLTARSSNSTLIPESNIGFGGSGSNRTVILTPASGQIGSSTITISVSDGPLTSSNSFILTVNPSAPGTASFTNPAAITLPDSGPAALYPSVINVLGLGGTITNVTVALNDISHTWPDDFDIALVSPAGQRLLLMSDTGGGNPLNDVTVTFSDSATQMLPDTGRIIAGTFRPTDFEPGDLLPGLTGPFAPSLSVFNGQVANGPWALYVFDDGAGDQGLIAGGWSLTITTVGLTSSTPSISNIADQSTGVDTAIGPIAFTIADSDTLVNSLLLRRNSSNPTLIPTNNIVFGGSGANRTMTITPAAGQTGTATITITVSDGVNSSSDSFAVTVNAPSIGTKSFTNSAAIQILDALPASPYPSSINVSGMTGIISSVAVTLQNLNHTWPADIDILLVSPAGQKAMIFSDAGGGNALADVTVTLQDSASAPLPDTGQIVNGTFQPTDYTSGDIMPAPAPNGPYGSAFSLFNGQLPNGNWSLYVVDDGVGDQGTMAGGWSLSITTVSAPPTGPSISDISDQTTFEDMATPPILFTINDPNSPVNTLVLTKSSSNPILVPTNNIVLGGSGTNRTITITPAPNQFGSSIIGITVSDGATSANDTFVLTVTPVNDSPSLSNIPDQSLLEDTATAPIPFTVADVETAASALSVSAASSNPALIPNANITFGGSNSNRTITLLPATNQFGSATITVTVSDGQLTASKSLVLTVTAVNDPPTISTIGSQSIPVNTSTDPIPFTVGDVDTPVANLSITANSSNLVLVPLANIALGGVGASRSITVTPSISQTGSALITLTLSDGQSTVSTSFLLTVSPLLIGTKSFTNATPITLPDSGAGALYPSTLKVAGMAGVISNVTVTLRNITHTWPDDFDILLVGPTGQKALIFSDAGGGNPLNNVTVTLSDYAPTPLPDASQIVSGAYQPADYVQGDLLPAPAPAGPYTSALSAFTGQVANGLWALYVVDDGVGDQGGIAGGWAITVSTGPVPVPVLEISRTGPTIDIGFTTVAGLTYVIECKNSTADNAWIRLDSIVAAGPYTTVPEPILGADSRFYRVRVDQ